MTFGPFTVNMRVKKREPHFKGTRKQPKRAERTPRQTKCHEFSILQKVSEVPFHVRKWNKKGTTKGLIPMYSEEVICRWTPKAFWNHHCRENKSKQKQKRQRPGTIREWISSNVAFEREAKSVYNKIIADFEFLTQQKPEPQFRHKNQKPGIWKKHHSDRANPKKDRHQNEEAHENQLQQINWIK